MRPEHASDGAAIDWFENEHDWQAGQLQLHVSLEFTPTLY